MARFIPPAFQMLKNVLLIDDDPEEADVFSAALGEIEMNHLIFIGNGMAALPRLLQSAITSHDVIFLHSTLCFDSDQNGASEFKSLAKTYKIPVVLCSPVYSESHGNVAADVGATAYVTKPMEFES